VSITPIEENNQILISSNAQEYDAIMAAISRLDIEPLQVYIEAKVIEVTLTEGLTSGVEWLFGSARNESDSGDDTGDDTKSTLNKNLFGIRDTESAVLGSSLSYVLTGVDVTANINAQQTNGRVSVLSTPSIFVLNNKEASINVGRQIPIPTNNFGSSFNNNNNSGNFRSSVSYRQTGVKLQVKPRINPGGLVYLELTQEVSAPGTPDPNTNNVPIDNRDLTTEVAIQSGQTIVMGGLISENNSKGYAGVPVLGKVPLLGKLFSQRTKNSDRTELIVLLTPTVIENPAQAKQLTKEYANQFKGLKPLKVKDKEEE
ncbi:MAG: type II secretion system protein GspD, partial [Marinicellaceae bacterium]